MKEAGGARIGPKNGFLLLARLLGKDRGLHAILSLSPASPVRERTGAEAGEKGEGLRRLLSGWRSGLRTVANT